MDSSMRIGLTHFGTIDAYRIYTLMLKRAWARMVKWQSKKYFVY